MNLMNLLAPTYVQMLQALSGWMAKAQAQLPGEQGDALLAARLAPDMYPLATQVRFACVQAIEGVARLRDEPFPLSVEVLLNEGRNAGDDPGTFTDAQGRISDTVAWVQSMSGLDASTDPDRPIAHALPNGMIFDFSAQQYARDWALPQFYFHIMTGYAILRNAGVQLGKADYAAHLFPFIRPETMPKD